MFKIVALLFAVFVVAQVIIFIFYWSLKLNFIFFQAVTELSPIAKECIKQTGIEADTVRTYIGGSQKIPEDNDLAQKFFACVFGTNVNDANEVVLDAKIKGLAKKILSDRLGSNFEDLDGVSNRLITECATLKGANKGLTAIKVTNCYSKKITDLQSY